MALTCETDISESMKELGIRIRKRDEKEELGWRWLANRLADAQQLESGWSSFDSGS